MCVKSAHILHYIPRVSSNLHCPLFLCNLLNRCPSNLCPVQHLFTSPCVNLHPYTFYFASSSHSMAEAFFFSLIEYCTETLSEKSPTWHFSDTPCRLTNCKRCRSNSKYSWNTRYNFVSHSRRYYVPMQPGYWDHSWDSAPVASRLNAIPNTFS